MALTKVGCPECAGKDKHCPACDGTNHVYITSVDGHLFKEQHYANYFQAWEALQQTIMDYQEDVKNSLETIFEKVWQYSPTTKHRLEGEFRAYTHVLSLIAKLSKDKNL